MTRVGSSAVQKQDVPLPGVVSPVIWVSDVAAVFNLVLSWGPNRVTKSRNEAVRAQSDMLLCHRSQPSSSLVAELSPVKRTRRTPFW